MTTGKINSIIKECKENKHLFPHFEAGAISDGYHTFDELYEHRCTLYIALCKATRYQVWKSKLHHDGTGYDGWFILGIGTEKGKMITYHIPMSMWDEIGCEELDTAYEWDGHTSNDVLKRLLQL